MLVTKDKRNGAFHTTLAEAKKVTKAEPLQILCEGKLLFLADEDGNAVYIKKQASNKNLHLAYAFGDRIILPFPNENEVIRCKKQVLLGYFPDLQLLWFSKVV